MRRVLTVLLVALSAVLSLSTSAVVASAAAPTINRSGYFSVDIPFPDVCSFSMTATVAGRTTSITFTDSSGSVVRGFSGGQLFVTWVRDDTGLSRTFAISGPTFFDATGTAVLGTGRWTTPMVDQGWVLATGHLTFDGTQDGFSLISTMNGHSVSLCELMG